MLISCRVSWAVCLFHVSFGPELQSKLSNGTVPRARLSFLFQNVYLLCTIYKNKRTLLSIFALDSATLNDNV